MKIGYQGEIGSNAEAATMKFLMENNIVCDIEKDTLALTNSKNTVEYLKQGKIDLAVLAVKNSLAGVVEETEEAVKGVSLESVYTFELPIHHCLFKLSGVKTEEITMIASHIQAINQTKIYRNKYFKNVEIKEMNDTASSCRCLKQGLLPKTCAVIARENAGLNYGLEIVAKNIEDDPTNRTRFHIYKLAK